MRPTRIYFLMFGLTLALSTQAVTLAAQPWELMDRVNRLQKISHFSPNLRTDFVRDTQTLVGVFLLDLYQHPEFHAIYEGSALQQEVHRIFSDYAACLRFSRALKKDRTRGLNEEMALAVDTYGPFFNLEIYPNAVRTLDQTLGSFLWQKQSDTSLEETALSRIYPKKHPRLLFKKACSRLLSLFNRELPGGE